jgi:hypothetical protein
LVEPLSVEEDALWGAVQGEIQRRVWMVQGVLRQAVDMQSFAQALQQVHITDALDHLTERRIAQDQPELERKRTGQLKALAQHAN